MKHLKIFAVGAMLLLMAACSSSATDDVTPTTDGAKLRHLVITQTADEASRAIITESDATLAASWKSGDRLTYYNFNLSEFDAQTGQYVHFTGPLTATTTAATSAFEGEVTCTQGDALAVVYPAVDKFSPVSGSSTTKAKYSISLSGQDGTLATLAASFHYVYGVATVTAVTETTATASMGTTTSLLTVCKFSFVDGSGSPIAISSLTISYGGNGSDHGTYPQTATVTCSDTQEAVSVNGDAKSQEEGGKPLTVTPASTLNAVYVALLPTTNARTFCFTVTDGSGATYSGEADAQLTAGEYVPATGLVLAKQ